jgi:flagellar hook-length control protein FliK
MVTPPAASAADSAVAAAAPGTCQTGDAGAAGPAGAADFNDALASACDDAGAAPANAKSAKGGRGSHAKHGATGDAASSPTFPAWRLLIALEQVRGESAKAGKGGSKGTSTKDDEAATGPVDDAASLTGSSQTPQPVPVVPDLPIAAATAAPTTAPDGDNNDSAATSATIAGDSNAAPHAALPAATPATTAAGQAADAVAADDSSKPIPEAHDDKAETSASAQITPQPATLVPDGEEHAESASKTHAQAGVANQDAPSPNALPTTAGKAAMPSVQPANATKPAQAMPPDSRAPQAGAAPTVEDALVSDSATASTESGAASAQQPSSPAATDAPTKAADRAGDAAQTHVRAADGVTAPPGANGGNASRDASSQHGESDARGRNASPEPLMVSRAVAFASAMTLVASPDGTLRMASPLAAPAPVALLMAPEHSEANLDQMVQSMRVMVRDTVSEATVHLHPEHFGDVSIQVRVDGKTVSAVVNTESAGVREWLQGQEATIRDGLSEHGLQLERLVVQRDGRHDRRHQGQPQPGTRRRRTRDDAEGQQTFEVSV